MDLDFDKEWDFVTKATHQMAKSRVAGELVFILQILLDRLQAAKGTKQRIFLCSIYLRTKNEYLKLAK